MAERLADPVADDARLWHALQAAGLAQEVRALAQGLDTPLGEGGLGLSGGQSRRLALARLFLHDAPLWLLDEATEALNADTAGDVLRRLREESRGRSLLIASSEEDREAIAEIWQLVDALNGYITEQEPWVLAKDEARRERLGTVLATVTEGLRVLAEALHPVIPEATAKLWAALGAQEALGDLDAQPLRAAGSWGRLPAGTAQQPLAALFPRVETEGAAQ